MFGKKHIRPEIPNSLRKPSVQCLYPVFFEFSFNKRDVPYVVWPEPFFSRTRKLPCIFAALFVCYSSRLRLRDSLLRPCYDFLLFFTTQTRPVHRETDSGDEKFITPINKIHNPILGYVWEHKIFHSHWRTNNIKGARSVKNH